MSLQNDLLNITDGKNDATNLAAQLMRIVFKCDPFNLVKLSAVYPNLVRTVKHYMDSDDGDILDLPYDNGLNLGINMMMTLIRSQLITEIEDKHPTAIMELKGYFKDTEEWDNFVMGDHLRG